MLLVVANSCRKNLDTVPSCGFHDILDICSGTTAGIVSVIRLSIADDKHQLDLLRPLCKKANGGCDGSAITVTAPCAQFGKPEGILLPDGIKAGEHIVFGTSPCLGIVAGNHDWNAQSRRKVIEQHGRPHCGVHPCALHGAGHINQNADRHRRIVLRQLLAGIELLVRTIGILDFKTVANDAVMKDRTLLDISQSFPNEFLKPAGISLQVSHLPLIQLFVLLCNA